MVKLEIWMHGGWYELSVGKELKDQVREVDNIGTFDEMASTTKIDRFPLLVQWLKDNHYFQNYVRITHTPDVASTTFRPRLTLQNIEEEMKKLQESIDRTTGLLADEDRPDYGTA